MLLDKGLILKGVAGVAAVGGIATTGVALKEGTALNKLLFSSPKAEDGVQSDQSEAVKQDQVEDQDTVGSGATGDQDRAVISTASTPESKEDSYGIPKRCNDSSSIPCELTQEELEKIKFEGLGDSGDIKVENFPSQEGQKITLIIDSIDTSKKKYIFSNGSSNNVEIKRGDTKTVTLKAGKTKFTVVGGKLKERELGDYGLPKGCEATKPCTLTSTDLEDISFKDLEQGTEATTVTPTSGAVSLEIKDVDNTKRYIFSSSSQDVTISRGEEKKVILTSAKKTQFTGSESKLSKLALDNYGVPSSCTNSCTLTADDLGEIKFEELDGTGTVSSTAGNVTLKIDSSDTTNKRFTFENSGSPITIQKPSDTTKKITLSTGKNRFKGVNESKLKKIELDDKGIPRDCSGTCTLTADDLKEIKFSDFENKSGNVTVEPANQTISLTITNGDEYDFNNGSNQITIKKGTGTVELAQQQGTQFHVEGGKLVKGKKKSEAEIFNEKIEKAGFPTDESCKFQEGKTSDEKECKLTKDQFKKLKFQKFNGEELDESTLGVIDNNNFKVKIKKIGDDEKGNYSPGVDLKFIFDGFGNSLTIQKDGSNTIYLKGNSDTEFIVNSSGKLERAWSRQTLGSKLGLTCNDSFECTVKGPINLIVSGGQKHEGMSKSGTSAGTKFKVTSSANYKEGYFFKVEDANITLTKGNDTQTLNKEQCYQAKWDEKKWWLEYKAETCSQA